MSNVLESILLSNDERTLDKVNDFLEEDYKKTLKAMFVILLDAIKTKALEDINTIMSNIETIILNQESKNYNIINNAVREANYKIQEVKNYKDERELRNIKFRLVDLNRQMLLKKEKQLNSSLYDFYHYLVFEEKNIELLDKFLLYEKNILTRKDEFGNNILYNAIDKYCSLNREGESDDIKYFYEVITLILRSEEEKIIKEDKEIYKNLLNRNFCKHKIHVREILERFEDFYLIDSNYLAKKYNVSTKVHNDVMSEIDKFKFNVDGRNLMIDKNFITIDGEGSLCLDDAIYIEKNSDGSFYYYDAITDIPSFIPYGSKTFYMAMKNVETIYLSDTNINMYPSVIANDLCSLLPNENKTVILYRFLVDPDHNLDPESLEIQKGIIRVKNRLTYDQVDCRRDLTYETSKMLEDIEPLIINLKNNNSTKEKYRQIENLVKPEANYHPSIFTEKSISANIIQESSLLVNHYSGRYFLDNGYVYIYRNLEVSNETIIKEEIERLLRLSKIDRTQIEYKKTLNILKELYLISKYSVENKGHYGLGYDVYSHTTAAARRFIGSYCQYLTHEQVFNGPISDKRYYELEEETKEIVAYTNMKKLENSKFANEYNYLNGKRLIRKR